ncbi:hypothetical protein BH09VER1_BH09VER1_55300 [soil metagenome]
MVREEMLPRLRQRYANRGREGRSGMITEVVEQFGYSRKHAIKLLGAKAGWGGDPEVRKGRPPRYGAEVEEDLWRIWQAAEQPCGKRMAALREWWLPPYEKRYDGWARSCAARCWPRARCGSEAGGEAEPSRVTRRNKSGKSEESDFEIIAGRA